MEHLNYQKLTDGPSFPLLQLLGDYQRNLSFRILEFLIILRLGLVMEKLEILMQ